MARCVTDAAIMLGVIAQPDARDWYSVPSATANYARDLGTSVRQMRIAFSPDLGYATVAPEIAALVEGAVRTFEGLGASVERVGRIFPEPIDIYRPLFLAAFAHFARDWDKQRLALLDPGLRDVIEKGRQVSLEQYLAAVAAREKLGIAMQQFFEKFDLLLTPTLPISAFPAGRDTPEPTDSIPSWLDWNPFTYPFNLTQQPAASVPCGLDSAGLPTALQVVGPKFADARVLKACRAFEAARPFPRIDPTAVRAKAERLGLV